MQDTTQSEKLSIETVIDLIRRLRNDLIKDLLHNNNIQSYFFECNGKDISKIKLEFLRRDLNELLISPVDLVHYSSLIKEIRESNCANLSKGNNELFHQEIKVMLKKYI